jgi:hypothetical protein
MTRILGSALVVLLLFGCKKQSEEPSSQPAEVASAQAPSEVATTVSAAAPEPSVDLETLAVEEDFEQDAEKEISAQNLNAKLDELERQIGTE